MVSLWPCGHFLQKTLQRHWRLQSNRSSSSTALCHGQAYDKLTLRLCLGIHVETKILQAQGSANISKTTEQENCPGHSTNVRGAGMIRPRVPSITTSRARLMQRKLTQHSMKLDPLSAGKGLCSQETWCDLSSFSIALYARSQQFLP